MTTNTPTPAPDVSTEVERILEIAVRMTAGGSKGVLAYRELKSALGAALQAKATPSVPAADLDARAAALMAQTQIVASAWSLIGGRFDFGQAKEDHAIQKVELERMIRAELQKPELHEPVTDAKWHTPGIGEVHSSDHKQMIYCEAMNSDGEMVVSDTLAEKVAAALQANAAAVEPIGEVVVSKNEQGQIVAVTRQDEEGQILSIIAESAPSSPVPARAQGEIADAERYQFAAKHFVLAGGGAFGWNIAPATKAEWDMYLDKEIRASKGEKT